MTLQERIEELVAVAKMENPETPEWYIVLCVENYIKEYEREEYKEEIEQMEQEENLCEENKDETH